MLFRIGNLAQKELLQLTRDVMILILVLIGPMLQLALIARATTQGFHHQPIVVVDQDHSAAQPRAHHRFQQHRRTEGRRLSRLARPDRSVARSDAGDHGGDDPGRGWRPIWRAARRRCSCWSMAPRAPAPVMPSGRPPARSVRSQPSNRRQLRATLPAIVVRPQVRFNPTFNVSFFVISAQLGFIIYQVALIVAALGITRERELGTLEQLLVTPLQRVELIIGKAIPAVIVGVVNFFIMFLIVHAGLQSAHARIVRAVVRPVGVVHHRRGGLGVDDLGLLAHAAAGGAVRVCAGDDGHGFFRLHRAGGAPAAGRCSGSRSSFPFQHYLQILRGVMLRGADLSTLWPQALALVVLAMWQYGRGAVCAAPEVGLIP